MSPNWVRATMMILALTLWLPALVASVDEALPHLRGSVEASPRLAAALSEESASVELHIPVRRQWDCNYMNIACSPEPKSLSVADGTCHCGEWQCLRADLCLCGQVPAEHLCDGYCGETSAQEAVLWFGAYITQGVMRTLEGTTNQRDMLTCDPDRFVAPQRDLEFLLGKLGFQTSSFCTQARSQLEYNNFVSRNLQIGHPVIFGVFIAGSGSEVPGYEHIVLAVGKSADRWIINDHYHADPVSISMQPKNKSDCDAQNKTQYCISTFDNGTLVSSAVAVSAPPSVSCPARLYITGCADGNTTDCWLSAPGEPNGWIEPNWGVHGIAPVTYSLSVQPASPSCELKPGSHYVVVKTVVHTRGDDHALALRDVIRQYSSPFLAPATECFKWPENASSLPAGNVSSKDSAFFHFVLQDSDEHVLAKCP